MPRKVVSAACAKSTLQKAWVWISQQTFTLNCGHDVYTQVSEAHERLILAVTANDPARRHSALLELAAICLHRCYQHRWHEALSEVQDLLLALMERKGPRSFISSHEVLGVITEEVVELKTAVAVRCRQEVVDEECMDIALGALFSLASDEAGGLEW